MHKPNNIIASYIGGSRLYGLDTPDSDLDYRYITKRTDLPYVMGLLKTESKQKSSAEEDYVMYEVKHYINLLQKTNTAALEPIFLEESKFIVLDNDFRLLIENKKSLIDAQKLLKSTVGYVYNEKRLALGERTGLLGSKRKKSLETFGYSPKNVSQIIRIVIATGYFFKEGIYPLRLKDYSGCESHHNLAFKIKTQPENFTVSQITKIIDEYDQRIKNLLDKNPFSEYVFDVEVAAKILKQILIQ